MNNNNFFVCYDKNKERDTKKYIIENSSEDDLIIFKKFFRKNLDEKNDNMYVIITKENNFNNKEWLQGNKEIILKPFISRNDHPGEGKMYSIYIKYKNEENYEKFKKIIENLYLKLTEANILNEEFNKLLFTDEKASVIIFYGNGKDKKHSIIAKKLKNSLNYLEIDGIQLIANWFFRASYNKLIKNGKIEKKKLKITI